MSLNWDATEAPRWKELTDREKEAAIFQTMAVGIGNVNANNIAEYAARVRMLEQVGEGMFLKEGPDGGTPVSAWTDERLLFAQGLRTNVSYQSRTAFVLARLLPSLDHLHYRMVNAYEALNGEAPPTVATDTDLAKRLNTAMRYDSDLNDHLQRYVVELARQIGEREAVEYGIEFDSEVLRALQQEIRRGITEAVREAVEYAEDSTR